jgi:endonuclease/exonuclease/phosphatase (EEP) superfamily protein YafD
VSIAPQIATWAALGLVALSVTLTAMSRIRSGRWWVRLADFPRVQIALGLVLGGALTLVADLPRGVMVAVLAVVAVCLAYQALRILPYTPLFPRQVKDAEVSAPDRRIRILISNVLMENRDAARLLDLIRSERPDIVFLVETDGWWAGQLAPLDGLYPTVLRCPQDNYYGLHFYTHLRVDDIEVRRLVADDVPSVRAHLRLPSGQRLVFNGLHPRPPVPGQDAEERDAEILIVAREVGATDMPMIVAGDLNDVAWSRTTRLFQRVGGLLDPRRGRGMFNSFHADHRLLRWPLDHIFHDKRFTLVDLRRLPSIGSDHFPMFAELQLDPARTADVEEPTPLPGDVEEAREKIAEGLEAAAVRLAAEAADPAADAPRMA